jgi:succinyl-diaminopimelate desuccinylase
MKSGIAVMLNTLIDENSNEVGIFYTAEEGPIKENGLEILMPILQSDFDIEFAIVMEPTNLECQLGCLGVLNAELKIVGISSHSARPWIGDNPIFKLNEVFDFLKNNEVKDHNIEGFDFKEVLSATKIYGGIANNVIPSEINININYRFVPTISNNEAKKYIEDSFSKFGELKIGDIANGAMPNSESKAVRDFIEVTKVDAKPKQAWTDIARFSLANIPAINFGPGDPLLAHTVKEFVNKNKILESYKLLLLYLKGYR